MVFSFRETFGRILNKGLSLSKLSINGVGEAVVTNDDERFWLAGIRFAEVTEVTVDCWLLGGKLIMTINAFLLVKVSFERIESNEGERI